MAGEPSLKIQITEVFGGKTSFRDCRVWFPALHIN